MRKHIVALVVFASCFVPKAVIAEIDAFTIMPMVTQPTLSNDGQHIAALSYQGDVTQVVVSPFDNPRLVVPVVALPSGEHRITDVTWVNDDYLVISVSTPIRYRGLVFEKISLYLAHRDGSSVVELKKRGRNDDIWDDIANSPYLVSILPEDEDHILVATRDRRDDYYPSVSLVELESGEMTKAFANGQRIVSWITDRSGDIYFAISNGDSDVAERIFYIRQDSDDSWQEVARDYMDELTFEVVQFDRDTNSLLVMSNYELGKEALWRWDIETASFTELLAEAPGMFDATGTVRRNGDGETSIVGITYNDGFVRRHYFDGVQDQRSKMVSDYFARQGLQSYVSAWSEDLNRMVISTVSDSEPVKYFTFEFDTKSLNQWYQEYPALAQQPKSSVQDFVFESRDGMEIFGYITFPEGASVDNPVPLVVYPHGGPFSRDSRYFDPMVQMFASEGYAVLQVNFRGSTGFGTDYQIAGNYEWGTGMITDIEDAIVHIGNSGLVDVNNSCVVGASYGGYAALRLGSKNPEMFDCIVSISGVSDVDGLINQWGRINRFKAYVDGQIRRPGTSMSDVSPINHASEFQAPILLIHGRRDDVVNYQQSVEMYNMLRGEDKEVDYIELEYGTHYFDDPVNRTEAFKAVGYFLREHLQD